MTSVFSWQNSQLLPCFILYSKAKFACYSRCFLTSYFCIPVPYNEKDIFFGFQFSKVLQVFTELFNFSFFSVTGWGIGLDYCDIEWFALETNRDHSVIFEIASKYCISDSFVDYDGYSISSKGFLPTLVDRMVDFSGRVYDIPLLLLVWSIPVYCFGLESNIQVLLLSDQPA